MKKRIKDFQGKRVVVEYRTKANQTNIQQGLITYVGKDVINFNVGEHEFTIAKARVKSISSANGKKLWPSIDKAK